MPNQQEKTITDDNFYDNSFRRRRFHRRVHCAHHHQTESNAQVTRQVVVQWKHWRVSLAKKCLCVFKNVEWLQQPNNNNMKIVAQKWAEKRNFYVLIFMKTKTAYHKCPVHSSLMNIHKELYFKRVLSDDWVKLSSSIMRKAKKGGRQGGFDGMCFIGQYNIPS